MSRTILLFCLSLLSFGALAATDPVAVPSHHDVPTTMDRLEKAIRAKGLRVFLRIDHQANAKAAGTSMTAAQVIVFGNPKAGTRIMRRDPAAALDLPIRMAVYQDYDGKTWILYHDPHVLERSYDLEGCRVLDKMTGLLKALATAAGGE